MPTAAHIVLVPGAGSDPAYWDPLRAALADRGAPSTAVDLPCTDPAAQLEDYAEVVAAAVRAAGEPASDWWEATDQPAAHEAAAHAAGLTPPLDLDELFYNTCTEAQRRQAAAWERNQADAPFVQPWPRRVWPDVPTEVVALTDDLLFSPAFLAEVTRDRLGLPIRASPGGHLGMVSHPTALADVLLNRPPGPHRR